MNIPKMDILELLSDKKYVSGKTLGSALNISRAAVHKRINTLKKSGYTIETSVKGYKLVKTGDIINEFEILSKINKSVKIRGSVLHYAKIDSTQTKIKELAAENAAEGTIVAAEQQSGGYGRMKRHWSSAKGGLWFSLLLKPRMRPDETSKLALITAIALNRVLEKQYNIKSSVKWPNDILVKDKKISGIIVEMSAEQDMVNWVAAGIGINVNNILPGELKKISTTMKEILNKNIDRASLLGYFINEFDILYSDFQKNGFESYVKEYNSKTAYNGDSVTVDTGFETVKGINKGVDKHGKLIIDTKNGIVQIISGTLRKNNG
ncbi:MAG: biotin--[acetyl-CoA-carboxylase] ligase [Endomicrobia bacterium]|nr:biotin--[acetyl-CoA-carboxylase] ligase [Endomicrobiia bacterium]MCL2507378.1 biotin--[acetyl-CoA-carboxylase] ligase [Endomicrobiia bacterium]